MPLGSIGSSPIKERSGLVFILDGNPIAHVDSLTLILSFMPEKNYGPYRLLLTTNCQAISVGLFNYTSASWL